MGYGGNVLAKLHGHPVKYMRGPTEVRKKYVQFATFQWIDICKELLDLLGDTKALQRIGLNVTFASSGLRGVHELSDVVRNDDALSKLHFTFVLNLLGYHALDGMAFSEQYPHKLARLATQDDAGKAAAVASIRSDMEDWKYCRDVPGGGSDNVRDWVAKSPWTTEPCMEIIRILLEELDEEDAAAIMCEWSTDIFEGILGQCKTQEEANRLCRLYETQSAQTKEMSHSRRHNIPRGHQLLERVGRNEVEVGDEEIEVPKRPPDDFYQISSENFQTEVPRYGLAEITKKLTWWSPSSSSNHVVGPMAASMRKARNDDDVSFAELTWMADFLPENRLVVDPEGTYLYVLNTQDKQGAICWPMLLDGEIFHFDRTLVRLDWTLCIDIDQWTLQQVKHIGPSHMYAMKAIRADGVNGKCTLEKLGNPKDLIQRHVDNGMKGIKKAALGKLREHLKVQVELTQLMLGEVLGDTEEEETDLGALSIIMDQRPNISEEELQQKMQQRHEPSPEDITSLHEAIDEQVLTNLMLHQDFVETTAWVNQTMKTSGKARKAKDASGDRARRFFERAVPVLGQRRTAPKAQAKPKAAPGPHVPRGEEVRWRASVRAREHSILARLKPAASTIHLDNYNGCWKILYAGERLRPGQSSWTENGMGVSMRLALQIAWDAHWERTREPVPPAIQADIDSIPD